MFALLPFAAHGFNHTDTVSPIEPGQYNVACTNIEQNASLIAQGASASDYWEGRNGHYVTDLMVHPQATTDFLVAVPDQRPLYVNHHASNVQYAAIICYPTPDDNTDANYTLPGTGDVIPHMQLAGAAPKFANPPAKWPTIVFLPRPYRQSPSARGT